MPHATDAAGYVRTVHSPLGSFLCPPGFAGPTGLRALARESSALAEAARFVRHSARQRWQGRTTPYASRAADQGLEPVLLVPGFMAGDGTLGPMAHELRRLGWRTYRSAISANVGCTQDAADALERRVETIATRRGRKLSLVGHSLGGLLARAVAARRPDLVDGIVTLGSPMLAPGAAHSLLLFDLMVIAQLQRVGVGRLMSADCTSGDCARAGWERARLPLRPDVAFTSVFSRRDGVIDWRSCLDPQASTVEVTTSHLGMAFDPAVIDVVTHALVGRRVSRPARSAAAPDASEGSLPAASR
jgi:pimeloyl-ACP methyl ester carboxylesterase